MNMVIDGFISARVATNITNNESGSLTKDDLLMIEVDAAIKDAANNRQREVVLGPEISNLSRGNFEWLANFLTAYRYDVTVRVLHKNGDSLEYSWEYIQDFTDFLEREFAGGAVGYDMYVQW